jgi:hypothetical protein
MVIDSAHQESPLKLIDNNEPKSSQYASLNCVFELDEVMVRQYGDNEPGCFRATFVLDTHHGNNTEQQ